MAILVREHSFLFIVVPHTGGTAVAKALLASAGGEYLPAQPLKNGSGTIVLPRKHNSLPQLLAYGVLTPHDRLGMLVAGTARNPFEWLVSQYVHGLGAQGSPDDFEAWLVRRYQRRRRRPFGRILPARSRKHPEWLEGVDSVLRFERLQQTLDEVLVRVGITQPVQILPDHEIASGQDRDHRPWYTPRAREIAEAAFAGYLQRYGYAFD